MAGILSIAQSGLQVESLRLAVSANDVANAQTDGFQPAQVIATARPGGGVDGAVAPASDPVAAARADRAVLAPSRTDLAREVVTQLQAANAYRANLESARTSSDVFATLLSLKA